MLVTLGLCVCVCMFFPSIWVWFEPDLLSQASMFTHFNFSFQHADAWVTWEVCLINKWPQNWPLPQNILSCSSLWVHIGELRTRLRSSKLRECSCDVWCHCSRLLARWAGLLWRLRLGPGREGCGLAVLRRIQLLTRPGQTWVMRRGVACMVRKMWTLLCNLS